MVEKRFYNIDELATILGKSNAAIHGHIARKQFDAVPAPIKLGRRLAWLVDAVEVWIEHKALQAKSKSEEPHKEDMPAVRKKRGRPTKEEIKARSGQ